MAARGAGAERAPGRCTKVGYREAGAHPCGFGENPQRAQAGANTIRPSRLTAATGRCDPLQSDARIAARGPDAVTCYAPIPIGWNRVLARNEFIVPRVKLCLYCLLPVRAASRVRVQRLLPPNYGLYAAGRPCHCQSRCFRPGAAPHLACRAGEYSNVADRHQSSVSHLVGSPARTGFRTPVSCRMWAHELPHRGLPKVRG